VVGDSELPPDIEGVEGSGTDVLDHSPTHAAAGAAPAAGLACVRRLVGAQENVCPVELSLVLLSLGRRTATWALGTASRGKKKKAWCTHVLKSTHPR